MAGYARLHAVARLHTSKLRVGELPIRQADFRRAVFRRAVAGRVEVLPSDGPVGFVGRKRRD